MPPAPLGRKQAFFLVAQGVYRAGPQTSKYEPALPRLQKLLGLLPEEVGPLIQKARSDGEGKEPQRFSRSAVMNRALELALADGTLEDRERDILLALARALGMPEDAVQKVIDERSSQAGEIFRSVSNVDAAPSPSPSPPRRKPAAAPPPEPSPKAKWTRLDDRDSGKAAAQAVTAGAVLWSVFSEFAGKLVGPILPPWLVFTALGAGLLYLLLDKFARDRIPRSAMIGVSIAVSTVLVGGWNYRNQRIFDARVTRIRSMAEAATTQVMGECKYAHEQAQEGSFVAAYASLEGAGQALKKHQQDITRKLLEWGEGRPKNLLAFPEGEIHVYRALVLGLDLDKNPSKYDTYPTRRAHVDKILRALDKGVEILHGVRDVNADVRREYDAVKKMRSDWRKGSKELDAKHGPGARR